MWIKRVRQDQVDCLTGDLRSPVVEDSSAITQMQAHRDRGNTEKSTLDRCGDGTGVDHVDADVRTAVHPGDRDVRTRSFSMQLGPERTQRDFHAIGRPSIDGVADGPIAHRRRMHHERFVKRYAMAGRRLNRIGGDGRDVAKPLQRLV